MKNLALHPKIIISIVLSIGILFYIFSKILSNDSINAIEKTAKVIRETKKIHNFAKQLNEISKSKDKTTEATGSDKNNNIDSSEYYKFYTKSQLSEMKKYCMRWHNSETDQPYHAIDQAVYKWHGHISYGEFMNIVKNGVEITTKKGIYKVTEEWSAPTGNVSGVNRAATIIKTSPELLRELNKLKFKK